MTQLAFVIDQGRCIGCHACTVACKVEHGVELGVFRTWVKYIERGEFPDTRRHFAVLRCNHCTDAPCVEVCPVRSLYKREDGIVDFDPERCIGCKACMNACPYDALYIDPDSHTAAKCNFCAHRVELDLKPSCEVVCPVGAIISGDVEDPDSEVSRLLGTAPSAVRGAEQGTGPNVYYLGADSAALDPLAAAGGEAYLTTEVPRSQREKLRPLHGDAPAIATTDVEHPPPWGWRVSSYFLSKGVAAGAMMLAPLLLVLGAHGSALADVAPGMLALAGIAVTGVFLVWDLKQPRRFYYLFTKPQWRSWLTLGAHAINVAARAGVRVHAGGDLRVARSAGRASVGADPGRGAAGRLHGAAVQPVRGTRSVAEPAAAAAHDHQRAGRRRGGAGDRRDLPVRAHDTAARAGLDARARRRGKRRRDRAGHVRAPSHASGRAGGAQPASRPVRGALLAGWRDARTGRAGRARRHVPGGGWRRRCWQRRARARWPGCGSTRTPGSARARACP